VIAVATLRVTTLKIYYLVPEPSFSFTPCCSRPRDASTNSFDSSGDDQEFQCRTESKNPQLFTQSELNYVIRDLGLPKEKAELLGSRIKEKNLLAAGTSMYLYRSREQEFTS
jgi:hypothetical protein